jgi:hypothetical protein
LLQLIPRVLLELSPLVSQQTEVAEAVGIDAPYPFPGDRAARIAKAIHAHRGQCTLFVVHADADGDHEVALRDRVEPGRQAASGGAPIIALCDQRRSSLNRDYGFFGANIALDSLRRLPAFRRFEDELRVAVQLLGHGAPGRGRSP